MKACWAGYLCLGVFVWACGGEERDVAEPTTAPASTPEAANEGPGEELTPPIPPESMVQQMLGQRVLDHPEVQPYLHTEIAEHLPLTVHAVPELAEGTAALQAGGQSVRVVDAAADARFRFTAREDLEGPRVAVRFEIPAEGVVGRVVLELRDFEWSAVEADVAER